MTGGWSTLCLHFDDGGCQTDGLHFDDEGVEQLVPITDTQIHIGVADSALHIDDGGSSTRCTSLSVLTNEP